MPFSQNRLLGEIDEQTQQILASAFENYKSLDELSFSGMKDVFESAMGTPAPAIESAVKLYGLLNDVLTPEAQLKLCRYFQVSIQTLYSSLNHILIRIYVINHLLKPFRLLQRRGQEGIYWKQTIYLTTVVKVLQQLIPRRFQLLIKR